MHWTLPLPGFAAAVAVALLLAVGALALLHAADSTVKRAVIVVFTFLAGLFYVLEFFVPPDPQTGETALLGWNLTKTVATVGNATQVVSGFAFLLGVINLARIHGNNVRRLRPGWHNSVAFFAAFLVMVVFSYWRDWATWFPGTPPPPAWVKDTDPAHAFRPHDAYTLLFEGLLRNMEATMFAILAFYIVSAAYRAFRIRSAEAGLMMVTALILMLGQVPLGMALTSWIAADGPFGGLRIESVSQFILSTINGAVQRGIGFGVGLGMLAMALRIWLSLERGSYFGEE